MLGSLTFALVLGCTSATPPIAPRKPPPAATTLRPQSELLSQWLGDTARLAEQAGASPLQVLAFGAAHPGSAIDAFIHIPEGRCALLYARGSSEIRDIDLHVFEDDGTQVGADEAPDDLPTLSLCPNSGKRLYVSARIAHGHGVFSLGLHDVSLAHSAQVSRAVGARQPLSDSRGVQDAWPGLTDAIFEHRNRIGAQWVDLRRVPLPVDSRVPTRSTVKVPAHQCLDILVVPSVDAQHLSLDATDSFGRIFASASDEGANRSLILCGGDRTETVGLIVRPRQGRGTAVLSLGRTKTRSQVNEIAAGIRRYFLGSPAYGPKKVIPGLLKTVRVNVGEFSSVRVPANSCQELTLVPIDGLNGFQATVWANQGKLLAHTRGTYETKLFVCTKGDATLETEATGTPGKIRVHSKNLNLEDPIWQTLPIAASRLLSLHAFPGRSPSPEKVQRIELSDTRLVSKDMKIPPGQCLHIAVAAESQDCGIEMQIIDAKSSTALDIRRGTQASQIKACAQNGGRTLRLEMRTLRGRTPALISVTNETP